MRQISRLPGIADESEYFVANDGLEMAEYACECNVIEIIRKCYVAVDALPTIGNLFAELILFESYFTESRIDR
jgi:hypothetical protein